MRQSSPAEYQIEMHAPLVRVLIVLFLPSVALAFLARFFPEPSQVTFFLTIFWSFLVITGLVQSWKPLIAQWLLVIGLIGSVHMAVHLFAAPGLITLMVVPTTLAAVMIGLWASLAATIGVTGYLVFWANGLLPVVDPALIKSTIVTLWAMCGVIYLALSPMGKIITALGEAFERSRELLGKANSRREELNRTLMALTEASRRLERTRKELAIARQQADEARVLKEQFVANVSHELRTPLNIVTGFAEMMYLAPESYEGVGWTAELVSDLGELYRAGRHLQSLVGDILDLARIDSSRLPLFRELLDIRLMIGEAVATTIPLLGQRGLAHNAIWPETLPKLLVDQTRIRQVMLNLLNNAIRFTEHGGITVRVDKTDDAVIVGVHDTGRGIPPDQLEQIFDRFVQANGGLRGKGGAGLGLAISREFIKLHGGHMWAESKMGEGSTFFFSLPLPGATPLTVPLHPSPYRKSVQASAGPVVVLDSDSSIADMLSRYLHDRRVVALSNTSELGPFIDAEHPLAVVVNQPPGTHHDDWLGSLPGLCQRYNVPVLRCSLPSGSWLQQSTELDDCLTKPVTRQALEAVLIRYCPEPGTVLVVDDDHGFVSLMVRMLSTMKLCAEVFTAYSGADALRLVREVDPDLMLLDLIMPEIDGFAVVKAVRRDPALCATPIVAVTATSYAEEALLGREGYFTLSQSKGISSGVLTELLDATLGIVQPNYVPEESTSVPEESASVSEESTTLSV